MEGAGRFAYARFQHSVQCKLPEPPTARFSQRSLARLKLRCPCSAQYSPASSDPEAVGRRAGSSSDDTSAQPKRV